MNSRGERSPFAREYDTVDLESSKNLYTTVDDNGGRGGRGILVRENRNKLLRYGVTAVLGVVGLLVIAIFLIFVIRSLVRPRERRVVADMLVVDAVVWTGDSERPWAEAFSVIGGRIVDVGTTKQILDKYKVNEKAGNDSTAVVLPNVINGTHTLFVSPGFIDSHIHIMVGGEHMSTVQLRKAKSKEEMIEKIKAFITENGLKKGEWILGGDWDHENWGGSPLPDKTWFDDFTQDYPLLLNRLDGHMGVCNSLALKLANITRDTLDPPGGQIDRDVNGEPTGIVRDNAKSIVDQVIPINPKAQDKAYKMGMEYVNSKGITAVMNVGTFEEIKVFKRAVEYGVQTVRMMASGPLEEWQTLKEMIDRDGRGNDWLTLGSVKGYVDGSLGSHTAYMFENYTDYPGNGLLVTSEEDLYTYIKGADNAGLQVCVHAIGDKANYVILSTFHKVAQENGEKDRRFRVEHAQTVRMQDVPLFKDIIASVQPIHLYEDIQWAEKLLGPERIKDLYRFSSLQNTSTALVFGSDWYVQDPDVLAAIHHAVSRISPNYPNGFHNVERISVEDALRGYTVNAAYAAFKENSFGRIKKGLFADFVVLDRDITKLQDPWTEIPTTKVLYTVVNGDIVYSG